MARSIGIIIQLTEEELEPIKRYSTGGLKHKTGGFQGIMTGLQERLVGSKLHLDWEFAERIVRSFSEYGGGGWQNKLAAIPVLIKSHLELYQKSLATDGFYKS